MSAFQAVVFDLYGTLVSIHTNETKNALWRRMAAYYSSRGAEYSPRDLRQSWDDLCLDADRAAESADPGTNRYREIDLKGVFEELFRLRGVIPAEEEVREAAWQFRCASTTHLRAYAHAAELLSALRSAGLRVILLSNAQSCFTLPELELLGLADAFDAIYISSDHGVKKPDPRFFQIMLTEQDLDGAECLMVGNDPVCDIAGAKAALMRTFYIRSPLSPANAPSPEKVGADWYLRSVDLRMLRRRILQQESSRR